MSNMAKSQPSSPAFEEIPGLTDAFAAELAAVKRRDGIKLRLEQAREMQEAASTARAALMVRAEQGEAVSPREMVEIENGAAAGVSGVAMFTAVLPKAEAELAEAAKLRRGVILDEIARRRDVKRAALDQARKVRDAAIEAVDAAQRALDGEHPQHDAAFVDQVHAHRHALGWKSDKVEPRNRRYDRTFPVVFWKGVETVTSTISRAPNVGYPCELYDPGNPEYAALRRQGHVDFLPLEPISTMKDAA